jgi:hypothetical protein
MKDYELSKEWQPIDSLPTTAERVLVYDPKRDMAYITNSSWPLGKTTITHWMPLPDPPEAA